jgi:hypothetical protein
MKTAIMRVFADHAGYARAAQSPALTAPRIAALYSVAEGDVPVIPYPLGRAIKIVMPRRVVGALKLPAVREGFGKEGSDV